MTTLSIACSLCEEPISHDHASHLLRYEVSGWEKPRAQGGTNALEVRQRTGRVAHADCVRRMKQPQSEGLF